VTGDSHDEKAPPLGSCCLDHRFQRSTEPPPADADDDALIHNLSLATKAGREEGRRSATTEKMVALIEIGAHHQRMLRLLLPWKLAGALCRQLICAAQMHQSSGGPPPASRSSEVIPASLPLLASTACQKEERQNDNNGDCWMATLDLIDGDRCADGGNQQLRALELTGEEPPPVARDLVSRDPCTPPDTGTTANPTAIHTTRTGAAPQPLSGGSAAREGLGPARCRGEASQLL
jgi:hypothetical protein